MYGSSLFTVKENCAVLFSSTISGNSAFRRVYLSMVSGFWGGRALESFGIIGNYQFEN